MHGRCCRSALELSSSPRPASPRVPPTRLSSAAARAGSGRDEEDVAGQVLIAEARDGSDEPDVGEHAVRPELTARRSSALMPETMVPSTIRAAPAPSPRPPLEKHATAWTAHRIIFTRVLLAPRPRRRRRRLAVSPMRREDDDVVAYVSPVSCATSFLQRLARRAGVAVCRRDHRACRTPPLMSHVASESAVRFPRPRTTASARPPRLRAGRAVRDARRSARRGRRPAADPARTTGCRATANIGSSVDAKTVAAAPKMNICAPIRNTCGPRTRRPSRVKMSFALDGSAAPHQARAKSRARHCRR